MPVEEKNLQKENHSGRMAEVQATKTTRSDFHGKEFSTHKMDV
jgi:hypothetical protein